MALGRSCPGCPIARHTLDEQHRIRIVDGAAQQAIGIGLPLLGLGVELDFRTEAREWLEENFPKALRDDPAAQLASMTDVQP